ncbi:MAG: MFS transporter [Caulobacteraceae bacterium]
MWLNAADSLVTSTLMPTVGRALGGYAYFSWATAAYMIGAILSGAAAARLCARLGLRRSMVIAGLATAASCAVSALSPSMLALVGGRALQGLGSGWIVGTCYAAIGAMFPRRHIARIFAVMTSVWGVATVLGPLIGGVFAEGGLWRALFWFFGAQALAFVAAAIALLGPERSEDRARVPFGQLALVMLGVLLIAGADLSGGVATSTLLCALSLLAFAAAVRSKAAPGAGLFPRAAREPLHVVGAAYISYFALAAASMGFSVYGPALLQRLYGLSPLAAGYAAGLESLGWTLAALSVAGLSERWHGGFIRLGGGLVAFSLAALAVIMSRGPLAAVLILGTVMGAGFGFSSGFTGRKVIASAGTERELASAGINSVRLIGSASGACLSGAIANLLGLERGFSFEAAHAAAIWLFALAIPVALIGAAGAFRVAAAPEPPGLSEESPA